MFTRSNIRYTEHSFYGTNIKINDQIINFSNASAWERIFPSQHEPLLSCKDVPCLY